MDTTDIVGNAGIVDNVDIVGNVDIVDFDYWSNLKQGYKALFKQSQKRDPLN